MDFIGPLIGILVGLGVLILLLSRTLVIVNQASTAIVERLGRYQRTLSPGLTILIPFMDRIRVIPTTAGHHRGQSRCLH
jgi:regulator of protease activity HflC (stomatin/prohibitin superfamily)